jgi:hypothetical protein
MKKLYIAFATFQNGANTIPIYYEADPGDDVIWIESESCRKNNIIKNSHKVLNPIGVRIKEVIPLDNRSVSNPNNITADLFDYLTPGRIKNYGEIIVLVGGGTKPTSIALFYAALYLYRNYDDVKVRTYYLNYSPIEKIEFDFEKQQFQSKDLVIKRALKLNQIFEIYGISINTEPVKGKPTSWKLFIQNRKLVNEWHKIMSIPPSIVGSSDKIHFYQMIDFFPPFRKSMKDSLDRNLLKTQIFKKLDKKLDEHRNESLKVNWKKLKSIITEIKSIHYRDIYNAFSKHLSDSNKKIFSVEINENVVKQLKSIGWIREKADNTMIRRKDIGLSYGTEFERMVKGRFDDYLSKKDNVSSIISDIQTNVFLYNNNGTIAEHDIILLLKNGVAISLECKTHEFGIKDASARVMRLTQASGSISEFIVIAPFFPSLDKTYFMVQHNLKISVNELGIKFIGFGPERTKKEYMFDDLVYANESFEKGLDRLFKPYLRS